MEQFFLRENGMLKKRKVKNMKKQTRVYHLSQNELYIGLKQI